MRTAWRARCGQHRQRDAGRMHLEIGGGAIPSCGGVHKPPQGDARVRRGKTTVSELNGRTTAAIRG
jgi:hypothetical protein